ncbi:MAG: zf-HC2 domain-containing protein [Candidatus Zhuqueibacterota bacterium]
MGCNEIRQNLSAYLHGEMSQQERVEMHRHLWECKSCLNLEMELIRTNRLLNRFQFQALPEKFDEQLAHKLDKLKIAAPRQRKSLRRLVYAVAATIIITLGLEIFIYQVIRSTQSPLQLADYPTKQAVFSAARGETVANDLWKQRFLQKYKDSGKQKMSVQKLKNDF